MPQFRWPCVSHDVALAKEVISCRPSKAADWEGIAGRLSASFSSDDKPVEVKGRGCRERMDRLLDKLKSEDTKALKRSGTEEEYTELTQLLEDVFSYNRDVQVQQAQQVKEKEAKKKKEAEDKLSGETMRNSAMERLSKRKRRSHSDAGSEESNSLHLDSDSDEDSSMAKGKGKQKRASKLSVMEMLENKAKRKASLKERELDIRDKELNLQRVKFESEQEERVRKEEEQRRRQELEFEERKLTLELLRKLVNKD